MLAKHPRFVGVRHVVQDEPDDAFMLQPDFLRGISRLKQFKLSYDILVFPKQLPAAIELARKFPEQPFVLDHLGKPCIRDKTISPWREHIVELARNPNVFCKVSGMITEAAWTTWKPDDLKPYLEVAFEAFGEKRLMYGSDWPVCLLAGTYARMFETIDNYAQQLGADGRARFFGGNAARFYGIESSS